MKLHRWTHPTDGQCACGWRRMVSGHGRAQLVVFVDREGQAHGEPAPCTCAEHPRAMKQLELFAGLTRAETGGDLA